MRSDTALARKIDNVPTYDHLQNLRRLAIDILQPVRDRWGKPITVTSGYRSPALNRAVKGASGSQHLKGEAADIVSSDNRALYALMTEMVHAGEIEVGQLIDESGLKWIHVSLPDARHHNEIFPL